MILYKAHYFAFVRIDIETFMHLQNTMYLTSACNASLALSVSNQSETILGSVRCA